MVFKIFILGHILGDFYFQSEKMAEEKKKDYKVLLQHSVIYAFTVLVMIMLFGEPGQWGKLPGVFLLTGISHGGIDWLKSRIQSSKFLIKPYAFFLTDQILHMTCLYILSTMFFGNSICYGIIEKMLPVSKISSVSEFVIAILLCWKPASIFIAIVFSKIPEKNKKEKNEKGAKVGALIGILEREIILLLGTMGQFGAIGFVLTAKSLARYKQLEDKEFAEKYIVGTLLSALIALACICVINGK